MTAGVHEAPPAQEGARAQRTSWVLIVIVGLIAAAVGLGAGYMVFTEDSGAQVDARVEALLDDFYTAVNEGDVAAIQEMSEEGAQIFGVPVDNASTLAGSLENLARSAGGVSRVGDPIVDETGFIYHAAQLTEMADTGNDVIWLFDLVGIDELTIVNVEPWVAM